MKKSLPQSVVKFKSKYPEIWKAFAALGEKCHEIGPLDEKTRRLVKLGIAIAARHEGAVHSATRNGLNAGITAEELFHAAILSITTIGWPSAYAAMTWINEVITGAGSESILSDFGDATRSPFQQPDPEKPVPSPYLRTPDGALQDCQLLSQG